MYNYILSFKFEGSSDEVAERFAKGASMLLRQAKLESYTGVENLQVAIVKVEDKVAGE